MKVLTIKASKVSKFLILNDLDTVKILNKKHNYTFEFFPDPVSTLSYKSAEFSNIRKQYGIANNNKIFLVFGALSEVKNIDNLVAAFSILNYTHLQRCTLLVMGKGITGEENFEEKLVKLKKEITKIYPEFEFKVEYNYIDEIHHANIFKQVDFIYLAYKNFYFSSATLGIAARAKKISIVPNYGPMADLAKEYKLGVLVNPDSVEEIKKGIVYCIENQEQLVDTMRADEFCNTFTHENFAKAILE